MKSKITTVFIVVIVLVVSVIVYKYFYAPRIISTNSYPVISCTDTDGNDIFVKGYNHSERDEPGESNRYDMPDYCEQHPKAGLILREVSCEGYLYVETRTTCGFGYGCVQGACVKK